MSAVRPALSLRSVSHTMSHNTRQDGASACTMVPSSTQAVFKAGSTAVMAANRTAPESVSKRAVSSSDSKQGSGAERGAVAAQSPAGAVAAQSPAGAVAAQSPGGAVAAQSPSEPLRMLAVKAEFERRLEKQVSIMHAAVGCT